MLFKVRSGDPTRSGGAFVVVEGLVNARAKSHELIAGGWRHVMVVDLDDKPASIANLELLGED